MVLTIGDIPVAVRLTSVGAMTGVANVGPAPANIVYSPDKFVLGRFDYVDPNDYSLGILKDGGLLQFDDGNISVTEIRAFLAALGTITVSVQDDDGTHSIALLTAQPGINARYVFDPPIQVLPGQRIKIVTNKAGSTDVYIRRPFKT
jgi:hypothetical protein